MARRNRKTKTIKAQITLFIILGVIILLFTVAGMYLFSTKNSAKPNVMQQTITKNVQDYIQSCLTITAKEAIKTFGKQGGAILTIQGGKDEDYPGIPFQGIKVKYNQIIPDKPIFAAICEQPECPEEQIYYPQPPEYPWPTYPNVNGRKLIAGPQTMLGQFNAGDINDWQEEITTAIQNNILKCGFEDFEQQGLSVQLGTPIARTMITEKDTKIFLHWPVKVTAKTGETAQVSDYITTADVRLQDIHDQVEYALGKESTKTTYDIKSDPQFTEIYQGLGGTILSYTEENSKIDDQNYEYHFAIPDRRPAMTYINFTGTYCTDATITTTGTEPRETSAQIKFEGKNCSATIPFFVYDRDADMIKINYTVEKKGRCITKIMINVTANNLSDWQIIGVPEAEETATNMTGEIIGKRQIINAIDSSGSMRGAKITSAKNAVKEMATEAITNGDNIGLIAFGSDIKVKVPPTNNIAQIETALANLVAGTGTDIDMAISEAIDTFIMDDTNKQLIIVSDMKTSNSTIAGIMSTVDMAIAENITISIVLIAPTDPTVYLAQQITQRSKGKLYLMEEHEDVGSAILRNYYEQYTPFCTITS